MNLVIDTTALDKSSSAVTSLTDPTPVGDLQELTVGDSEPMQIQFIAGAAGPPAWAGEAGYVCTVGIGMLDVDGLANYCSAILGTPVAAGWSGRMGLNTQQLYDNLKYLVGSAVDWTRFRVDTRQPYARPYGGWLGMQITITDPSGNVVTYADLRIFIRVRVMPKGAGTTGQSGVAGGVGGSAAATAGNSSDTFTFAATSLGQPFANSCTGMSVALIPPTPAGPFIDVWLSQLPSATGFSVAYGAPIPGPGWTLLFTATGT